MGQIPTKPQQPNLFGFEVSPRTCQWCGSDLFQCKGACLEKTAFSGYPSPPYIIEARIQEKKNRRKTRETKKSSPREFRKSHSRNPSTSSTASATSFMAYVKGSPIFSGPSYTALPPSPAMTEESAAIIPRSVFIPVEEQALCYFLANWVLLPGQGCKGGYMEYIIPLYSSCKPNSHLHYALSAASLAAFGNRPNCRQNSPKSISAKASSLYAKALEHTNMALRNPLLVKEDETLAAVLMLGFFETITTYRSQTAWGSHNEGAVALVKLRGADNFKTEAGRTLLASVRSQTLVGCLHNKKSLDPSIDWHARSSFRDRGAHDIMELLISLIELQSDCERVITACSRVQDPSHTSQVLGLLARAKAGKEDFTTWARTRSNISTWDFGPTAFIEKLPPGTNLSESEVFPGRIDVYNELWAASIWNMGRTCGLLFSSTIVRCAAWLSPHVDFHTLKEYQEAAQSDRKLVEDMIASVPYLLGWHKRQSRKDFLVNSNKQGFSVRTQSSFACGDDGPTKAEPGKALGGYFSMWPMFIAAISDFSTDVESRWIHGRLRFISDHMGIRQANYFATTKLKLPSMTILRDQMELESLRTQSMPSATFNYLGEFTTGQP